MGFRLNLKWGGLSVQSPLSTSTSYWPSSYSCRGRDSSHFLTRLSATSDLYRETETLSGTSRPHVCSSSPQLHENYYLATREIKEALGKGSSDALYNLLDKDFQTSKNEDKLAYLISLQGTEASQFRLLMKNLELLEDMFADSNAVRLERDILEQLERLGALRLFHSCLSRTLESSSSFDFSNARTELVEVPRLNDSVDTHVNKVVVRSGKKEFRKLRRKRTLEKESNATFIQESPSETDSKYPQQSKALSASKALKTREKRPKIARDEAEMATAVKVAVELEKIRMVIEEQTGEIVSLSSWAEAAGVKTKELQQHLLYGWHCRDELLRSTRPLVLFISRSYLGLGIAFEDLIQAGKIGVLQGAERFDQSRGYKFSTYVQYWIRKSMSTFVAKNASGIHIPWSLRNKVQKARKTLMASNGKYPDDTEIAQFTGLPIAKIMLASGCLGIVGSINQKIGESNINFMEMTPDTSIPSPEETVLKQHMRNDVYNLLNSLEPREKQVLILRYGLGNHPCKSLNEIGKIFCVSKECARKIERTAFEKLRNENSLKILNHYVCML